MVTTIKVLNFPPSFLHIVRDGEERFIFGSNIAAGKKLVLEELDRKSVV
jgi:hypothetical protein